MRRIIISMLLLIGLVSPAVAVSQSGDASWLESLEGLETGIGRAWMGEIIFTEEITETEFNDEGTPVHEIGMRTEPLSTPEVTDEHRTMMLSVFVFRFDSEENAATGLEDLNTELMTQHSRDPRNPAVNEFEVTVGDAAHGWQGEFELPTSDNTGNIKMSVVYLMVQDGDLVYQIHGQFQPGYGEDIAEQVANDMVAADLGDDEPAFDPNGGSTGGLWEKLNAVDVAFPDGVMTYDLQIWPMDPNAVQGESVQVPVMDLNALGETPGLTQGWHAAYGEDDLDPESKPEGVYSIELWVMEFDSVDTAMAAAFAVQTPLLEPMGIISGGNSASQRGMEDVSMLMNGSGFVRDRAIPEGDAAYVIIVEDSTLIIARVYANNADPESVAMEVVQHVLTTSASDDAQDNEAATGGGWDRLPAPGSDTVHGLPLRQHEFIVPVQGTPVATPQ